MPPRLIIRLDDACPTMLRSAWLALESELDALGIRPIVGVIPECRDANLRYDPPAHDFWSGVRRWQDKGWTIALHGFNHVYHNDPAGHRALVPFHRRGEFVGVSFEEQKSIFRRACAIFERNGVISDTFMAPSHSFDRNTLEALRAETGIRRVTDGISFRPFNRFGFTWLPQQIWNFWPPLPFGLWTVCLHPNSMSLRRLERTIASLRAHRAMIVDVALMTGPTARYGVADFAFAIWYWSFYAIKEKIRFWLKSR